VTRIAMQMVVALKIIHNNHLLKMFQFRCHSLPRFSHQIHSIRLQMAVPAVQSMDTSSTIPHPVFMEALVDLSSSPLLSVEIRTILVRASTELDEVHMWISQYLQETKTFTRETNPRPELRQHSSSNQRSLCLSPQPQQKHSKLLQVCYS
jgi:hypothetical protein